MKPVWSLSGYLWPELLTQIYGPSMNRKSGQMGKRFLSYDLDISLLTLGGFNWFEAPLLLSFGYLQS